MSVLPQTAATTPDGPAAEPIADVGKARVRGAVGFHDGEVAVQRRAGVRAQAVRLSSMLAPPDLDGGAGRFLRERTFAVMTARDPRGRLWTSPLVGARGFLDGERTMLRVRARPAAGDPLHDISAGQAVGLVAIDFARRRRMRVNGHLVTVAGGLA